MAEESPQNYCRPEGLANHLDERDGRLRRDTGAEPASGVRSAGVFSPSWMSAGSGCLTMKSTKTTFIEDFAQLMFELGLGLEREKQSRKLCDYKEAARIMHLKVAKSIFKRVERGQMPTGSVVYVPGTKRPRVMFVRDKLVQPSRR